MRKIIILAVGTFIAISGCFAQTIVKMSMQKQPDNALEVTTLFDESLPVNTTIVLGTMGYNISGGTSPYTLTWMKDNQVIATGDIAVIQPVSGSNYALKVTDKNNCSYTTAINLNVSGKISGTSNKKNNVIITPTIVTNQLTVSFSDNEATHTRIRIFNTSGVLSLEKNITGNTTFPVQLEKGTYYVVSEAKNLYSAEKIIVK